MLNDTESQRETFAGQLVKDASTKIRLGFIRKVYALLSAQLLLTVAIATPLTRMSNTYLQNNAWLLYLSVGVTLVTICAMACCRDLVRRFPSNYIFLFIFTAFEGVTIGFISAAYTWQSAVFAAGATCLIFLVMTAYTGRTKQDFTGCGPYFFSACSVFCVFGEMLCIMTYCGVMISWLTMFFDACGVLLFTFYIVYDTQLVIGAHGRHKFEFSVDDYAFAALNLYLDVINPFIHVLSLFGKRR